MSRALEIDGEPPIHYDAVISLSISAQTITPETITSALGMEPKTTHRRGDTTRRLPSGRVVPRRPAPENFWTRTLLEFTNPPGDLPAELDKLLDQLEHARTLFDAVRDDGGKVEFFIGYFMRASNTGDNFTAPLLARLAAFGIGLNFDIYDPGERR